MHKALAFIGGLIIGAAGGYYVGKIVYTKAKEEEIASIEAAFKAKSGKTESKPADEKPREEKIDKTNDIPETAATLQRHEEQFPKTDYTKYVKEANTYNNDAEVALDIEKAIEANRNKNLGVVIRPGRVITRGEYNDNEDEYAQESLTYYEQDRTVATLQNDIFEEVDYLPVDFEQHFDDNLLSNDYDRDVVYVRNDDLEIDYEITKDERSFSDVVQHLE